MREILLGGPPKAGTKAYITHYHYAKKYELQQIVYQLKSITANYWKVTNRRAMKDIIKCSTISKTNAEYPLLRRKFSQLFEKLAITKTLLLERMCVGNRSYRTDSIVVVKI